MSWGTGFVYDFFKTGESAMSRHRHQSACIERNENMLMQFFFSQ